MTAWTSADVSGSIIRALRHGPQELTLFGARGSRFGIDLALAVSVDEGSLSSNCVSCSRRE